MHTSGVLNVELHYLSFGIQLIDVQPWNIFNQNFELGKNYRLDFKTEVFTLCFRFLFAIVCERISSQIFEVSP